MVFKSEQFSAVKINPVSKNVNEKRETKYVTFLQLKERMTSIFI
jgi:hypothetical protein